MRLVVAAVGRVKDAALRDACDRYAARVRRYLRLEVREVRSGSRPDADAAGARRIEGAALLAALPVEAAIVALTRAGTPLSSEGFANRLAGWRDRARDVAFVIGGTHGLAEHLLGRADERLSLSALTLPHELARLVLLEQLYRACTILRGEPYHKGGR